MVGKGEKAVVAEKEEKPKLNLKELKKKRKLFYRLKMRAVEKFAALARAKFGNMIKSIALIGSLARGDYTFGSDIDVLVVIDDTAREVPEELKAKLLAMLTDLARKIDKKFQIQLHTVTELFQFAKTGDNIIYNFLRHMKVVYDAGFLRPLERLLKRGEIKPTKEAMSNALEGADYYMKKVEEYVEWILERYYRAVTWAANAFIMSMGLPPAAVPEIPAVLQAYADKGVLPPEIPKIAAEVIAIYKAVEHGNAKPELKVAYELEERVKHFLDVIRKEVVTSLVKDKLTATVKEKIKTMPKLIFEGKGLRVMCWFLDDGIYAAVHKEGQKEMEFLKAEVKEGKVMPFKSIKEEDLFAAMERSEIRPLINKKLIKMVHEALPLALRQKTKKVYFEYPGRAMLELGGI